MSVSKQDVEYFAVSAVAAQYRYKPNPMEYARELLARGPQTWAYLDAIEDLKACGWRATENRKNIIWATLGGE